MYRNTSVMHYDQSRVKYYSAFLNYPSFQNELIGVEFRILLSWLSTKLKAFLVINSKFNLIQSKSLR